MKLRISRIHFPVTVLGPGKRIGIWFQGCSQHCFGCVSQDTWSQDAGELIEVDELVSSCRQMTNDNVEGITITGGEPFEQPEGLASLLAALEVWRSVKQFDILCYSGFCLKFLENQHASLLSRLDALIPEPFKEDLTMSLPWRGSENQPLVILSPLVRERYTKTPPVTKSMQVAITDGEIWFIGIPDRGDMAHIQRATRHQGLIMEKTSWQK